MVEAGVRPRMCSSRREADGLAGEEGQPAPLFDPDDVVHARDIDQTSNQRCLPGVLCLLSCLCRLGDNINLSFELQ